MVKLKDLVFFRLINTTGNVFGFTKNEYVKVSNNYVNELKYCGQFKQKEEELNILYSSGFLDVGLKPKRGDFCYFWNGQDKNKSLRKGGPFIAQFYKTTDDGRFEVKDCDMLFGFCQKLNTNELEKLVEGKI